MARLKVTVSLQDAELRMIDERAHALAITRSAYLRALTLRDLAERKEVRGAKKRRVADFTA
jgi:hypothetical protein